MSSADHFSDLPNEIIIAILEFVQPGDLSNLACTSRHIHELLSERLAHHRSYFSRYGDLFLSDEGGGESPRAVLHAIKKNRDIPWYIRKICYNCGVHDWQFNHEEHLIPESVVLQELLNDVPFLKNDQTFLEEFNAGKQNECLIFVLALAKNVTHLQLARDAWLERYFEAASLQDEDYFGKLRVAETTQEYPLRIEHIQAFFYLPKLDSYTIHNLSQAARGRECEPTMPVSPRQLCKAINFVGADADGDIIARVLHNVTGLQFLELDFASPNNEEREDDEEYLEEDGWRWRTETFFLALQDCALDSLESLTLSFPIPPLDKLPPLTCFSKLREFVGPLNLLIITQSERRDGMRAVKLDLADCFPSSLESLALITWETWRESLAEAKSDLNYSYCSDRDRKKAQAELDAEAAVHRELQLVGLDACPKLSRLELSEESLCSQTKRVLSEMKINVTIGDHT